ncbi:hypothetical protein RFI_35606 [Reticulomyxa filosa]|uniref:TRAF-type domain-containing protein n=1 Tax=Reticulomyxa filosa TaxID=46433 RepID=X6LIQ9_RETFI|nr:hypothetical protein RFI_35606 [Reticulomyxa filosa]|eukprot:ETO01833.1 hypothetical protein RFI_35606 [Reticulomyxa filosa]
MICFICKEIANYPLEIICPEHENMNKSLIVGKNCLKKFLNDYNNNNDCKYHNMELLQLQINNLIVKCPYQFQKDLETPKNDQICNFKGSIKEIKDHLNNYCLFKKNQYNQVYYFIYILYLYIYIFIYL